MGVYIPPPNDNDKNNKNNNDRKNNNNDSTTNKNSNKNQPTNPITNPSSSSDIDTTTIVIPNPASLIPRNPSIGLIWGPLTPSSDNRPALATMIGLQFLLGTGCFRYARNQLRKHPVIIPNQPPKFIRNGSIWKSIIAIGIGSIIIFGSGLEISRMLLPYDPWYEESKHYRKVATKNGDKPNFWFGAYKYYKPMDLKTWTDKLGVWFDNASKEIDQKSSIFGDLPNELNQGNSKTNNILYKLNKKGNYNELYNKLKEANKERFHHILNEELREVNELNKAERLDLILEGKSELINEEFTKPSIQLGTHTMNNDDDFEMVWLNFEPWDELKLETDYDIRLIPRYAQVVDEEEKDDSKVQKQPEEIEKIEVIEP
ncbi:MGR1 [Candida pseudojiufengensis]|uniref:MGR1 n=1 Tax=Candida pseudojiufengensis TaxID=497109 RepID=UPI002224742F|nr:MGR1 [Candida pseudojiufengensis]KAI5964763.1 MGR1 [Candida pseudojiufengensis]